MAWKRLDSPKDKKVGLTLSKYLQTSRAEKWLVRELGASHDQWVKSGLNRFLAVVSHAPSLGWLVN